MLGESTAFLQGFWYRNISVCPWTNRTNARNCLEAYRSRREDRLDPTRVLELHWMAIETIWGETKSAC
jgi:hypothetical protein